MTRLTVHLASPRKAVVREEHQPVLRPWPSESSRMEYGHRYAASVVSVSWVKEKYTGIHSTETLAIAYDTAAWNAAHTTNKMGKYKLVSYAADLRNPT